MTVYILPIILLIVSSILKSLMDTIQFHWESSFFSKIDKNSKLFLWLNPLYSWQNKWKDKYKPNGEKFWGSSRWFAFLTDAWHFLDFLKIITFICILTFFQYYIPFSHFFVSNVLISRILDTIILYILHGIVFEKLFVLYEKIK